MTSTRSWIAATLTAAFLAFGGTSICQAQDPAKDEGLEKLLEKLGEAEKNKDKPPADKPKEEPKPETGPAQTKPKDSTPADKPRPAGEVAPKDQELDKLLEGLGQTTDKPAPDDKKSGGGPGSDEPMPPKSDKPKPEELKPGEKEIDQDLISITGKKTPKKNQKKGEGDPENGPLGNVVKEMREVEERLGQPDTGEATRKKQTEIVKNLDQLIEQMKNAPSQAQGLKMIREGNKPGQQPGNQQGTQPGAQARGAQPTKPTDPKKPPTPGGLDKSVWGQLPSQFREEMGNVMNEHPLPGKLELIRLYYLSLSNKSTKGED